MAKNPETPAMGLTRDRKAEGHATMPTLRRMAEEARALAQTPEQAARDELHDEAVGPAPDISDAGSRPSANSQGHSPRDYGSYSIAPKRRGLIIIALGGALVVGAVVFWPKLNGPGPSQREGARSAVADKRTADALLMQDRDKALQALLGRLHDQVQSDGEIILIEERPPLRTLHAFPSRTAWHIECDKLGLSVAFTGNGTQEEGVDAVSVLLTEAALRLDQCRELVPRLAAALEALRRR